MSVDLPAPGDLFEEKYRIVEQIGAGGFAAVYRAVDESTERSVAIKILTPLEHETKYSERLNARFEREARLLAGLKSQHTVTMYEFGRSADDLLYLVFEFVGGTTLSQLLRREGPQEPARVVAILEQVCHALAEAHSLGVLHRDIKPANIMVFERLEVRDIVKLLDFGIAKPMRGLEDGGEFDEATITTEGALLGTPRYMSPEQIAHQDLTVASDIYSLGLVAFEMLTGLRAIDQDTATGIIRSQLSAEEIEFPRGTEVPDGLQRVVARMTRKKRADRYQEIGEVLRDLKLWDESDVRSPVAFMAVAGLAVGGAILAATLLLDAPVSDAARAEEPTPQIGTPLFEVDIASRELTYIYGASTRKFELKGTRDADGIPDVARTVVAIERDNVPVHAGSRIVGDLSDWDGKSESYPFIVREVSEERFRSLLEAEMEAIRIGRLVDRNARAKMLEIALRTGQFALSAAKDDDPDDEPEEEPKDERDDGPGFKLVDVEKLKSEDPEQKAAEDAAYEAILADDWPEVIRRCKPYAERSRLCARSVAVAYRMKGNAPTACKYYELAEEENHGLDCETQGSGF